MNKGIVRFLLQNFFVDINGLLQMTLAFEGVAYVIHGSIKSWIYFKHLHIRVECIVHFVEYVIQVTNFELVGNISWVDGRCFLKLFERTFYIVHFLECATKVVMCVKVVWVDGKSFVKK